MMNGMTRRRRPAIYSAGSHLILAVASFALATWLAVDSSGGRCDDTASCLEVNFKLLAFVPMAYVCAFGLWTYVQSRLLRSLFGRKSPRQTSAAALNVAAGITALCIGLALGGWWFWAGFCLASAAIPGLVTSWAAQPLDPSHPYVPVWRRPAGARNCRSVLAIPVHFGHDALVEAVDITVDGPALEGILGPLSDMRSSTIRSALIAMGEELGFAAESSGCRVEGQRCSLALAWYPSGQLSIGGSVSGSDEAGNVVTFRGRAPARLVLRHEVRRADVGS